MRAGVFFAIGLLLGGVVRAAEPIVSLEAFTARKFYRQYARSEMNVLARFSLALPDGAPASGTRNVAFVLDRSGSMAGERIEAVRAALAATWTALAADDIVSVVLFGSEVEALVEAQRRGEVRDIDARIRSIEPAGGAALYDALNQAAAQLRRHAGPTVASHLILVCDGPPTKGPREADDFLRLTEVFAEEGITVSTIGIGPEFNDDLFAKMARIGGGRFRFVDVAEKLALALQAEVRPVRTVIAHDAVLSVEFKRGGEKVRAQDWHPAAAAGTTLTYRFPRLFAGQDVSVFTAAEFDAYRSPPELTDFAVVRLRWKKPDGSAGAETTRVVPVKFSDETDEIRQSLDPRAARAGTDVILREAFQQAIEQLDKNDPRRALRTLRAARGEVRDLNFDLEDAAIKEKVRGFDVYLADVQARGTLGALDRKILRSGLFNQFDPPAPAATSAADAKR